MSVMHPKGFTCPICGAPDLCGVTTALDGTEMYLCKRYNGDRAARHGYAVSEYEEEVVFPGWRPEKLDVWSSSAGKFAFGGTTKDGFGRFIPYEVRVVEIKDRYHEWLRGKLLVRQDGKSLFVTMPYVEPAIPRLKAIGGKWDFDPQGKINPKDPSKKPKSWVFPVSRKAELDKLLRDLFDYLPDGSFSNEESLKVASSKAIARETVAREEVKEIQPRPVNELDTVYRALLNSLCLEEPDRHELESHDKWDRLFLQSVLDKVPLRSLPPADFMRNRKDGPRYAEFCSLTNPLRKELVEKIARQAGGKDKLIGVPGFYKDKNGEWTIGGSDGYLIPQLNAEGLIYRLRIRLSNGARKEIEEYSGKAPGKYLQISSAGKECGCGGTSQLGFYGLWNMSKYERGELPVPRVIVCEGEKKGIVAAMKMGLLVISLSGVGTYRLLADPLVVSEGSPYKGKSCLEWLKEHKVERICVCNDMDMLQNLDVMRATKEALKLVYENGFVPEVGRWNRGLKGIDDLLMTGKFPKIDRMPVEALK